MAPDPDGGSKADALRRILTQPPAAFGGPGGMPNTPSSSVHGPSAPAAESHRQRLRNEERPMKIVRNLALAATAVLAVWMPRAAWASPLTLSGALAEANTSAADLATARSHITVARAGFASADKVVATNPTLSASYTSGAPFGDADRAWTLGVSQTFEVGGQQGLRRDVASSEVAASSAELSRVRNEVLGAVVIAFYGLDTARRVALVDREIAELYERLLGVARTNLEKGVGTKLDVLSLEVEVARLRAEEAGAVGLAASLEADLAALLGRTGAAAIEPLTDDTPVVPTVDPGALVAKALARRPELTALRARQRRFQAEGRLAVREAWLSPTFGVGVQRERMAFGREGFQLAPGGAPGLLGIDERRTAIVVSASIPLAVFDARAGTVARSSASFDLALAEEKAQRARIEGEVRAAAALVKSAGEAFAIQEKARAAATEAAVGYRDAYERRQIGVADLLLAQERLLRARLVHLGARGALLRAVAMLERATGAWTGAP